MHEIVCIFCKYFFTLLVRFQQFRASLLKLFQSERSQSLALDDVIKFINSENESFSNEEIMFAIDKMQDQNHIMLSENIIFLI